jgi:hypothetical protein
MKRKTFSVATTVILAGAIITAFAQKTDNWTSWSKKDAQKMLTDSPWSKTQVDTDASEQMYSPTAVANTSAVNDRRADSGARNQAINLTFHVRFFSARPVREALARMIELGQNMDPKTAGEAITRLHSFAEMKSPDSIIVTVTFESPDGRYSGPAIQAFSGALTATLKNDCYLQRADGKRLFLDEYVPPGKDGFGARFMFARQPEGQPFITDASGEIRFYAKLPNIPTVDRRFKVADMKYQGELEY